MIKNNYSEQSEIKEDKNIFYSKKTIKFLEIPLYTKIYYSEHLIQNKSEENKIGYKIPINNNIN